ncbi:nitrogen regulation protein NR(II) [Aestuariibacter halophilus]|uniref:Sensory histidine kinase/phosphatase NtrB n=1 Tax=Fluctibacter halophilus TaxID=226011 RepID=A0ABS8GA55_9ALTE|nr:nitrogen regulation protein NR(II) [Aestuariibacter halophilus]MCC2617477.1 nitrogen regulation protein NR(II) [Aestuariibacter halophilus]
MQKTSVKDIDLLDSLSTAVVVLDGELKITYVNHAAQTLLETSVNQLLGFPFRQFFAHASLDMQRLDEALQNGDDFSDSEVQLAFNDGRFVLADLTVTSIEFNAAPALLLEVRKIDQQRRISQESQQWAQQQAARELVRGLAHEIKNPLGGIRGAAQLLEKQLDSPDTTEFTQMIIEQSDRLRNLVDRLLGPNVPPNFQWHNVHRVLEKIRTLVNLDSSHSVQVIRDYDPSIPDLWLDQDMLQQAVLNIVRNAVQVLCEQPDGEIHLVTRIERQMTIHGVRHPLVAQIKISDNGPGIPAEIRDTLFYPMVTGKKDGTGLGLSIAQTLVDQHRGKIELESWPGHTEFTLYLPIDKKDSTE